MTQFLFAAGSSHFKMFSFSLFPQKTKVADKGKFEMLPHNSPLKPKGAERRKEKRLDRLINWWRRRRRKNSLSQFSTRYNKRRLSSGKRREARN